MDETESKMHVSARYQGVFEPLIKTDHISESSTAPVPKPNRMLETLTDERLTEDGFSRLLEG